VSQYLHLSYLFSPVLSHYLEIKSAVIVLVVIVHICKVSACH
jgi:hypothetical protein